MDLRVKRLRDTGRLPTRAHDTDHCLDFYAAKDQWIYPGQTVVIPLGIAVAIPEGYALVLKERSGLATKGIDIKAGVIDNPYRGELGAVVRWFPPEGMKTFGPGESESEMCTYTNEHFAIAIGDKICQGKLEKTSPSVAIIEVDELDDTDRGASGFGSTGT